MIERIRTTTANRAGSVVYWIADDSRGVPYAALHVAANGDYWTSCYGALCFSRPAHDHLIRHAKPHGRNITAEKFYRRA